MKEREMFNVCSLSITVIRDRKQSLLLPYQDMFHFERQYFLDNKSSKVDTSLYCKTGKDIFGKQRCI